MRKKHLRDIKDYFKGWAISLLSRSGSEQPVNLRVIPMLTDDANADGGKWEESDWEIYAHLLNVRKDDILLKDRHLVYTRDSQWRGLKPKQKQEAKQEWADQRSAYFDAAIANHTGDLFIDPDTGIGTPNSEERFPIYQVTDTTERVDHGYIYRSEIARLTTGSDRIVTVFQDAHRGKGYLAGVVNSFKPAGMVGLREYGVSVASLPKLFAFAYDAVHSSIVFVCGDAARLQTVKGKIQSIIPAPLAKRSIVA